MIFDEASFRDPAGKVFYDSNKVYRIVKQAGKDRIDFLNSKDLINKSSQNDFLIESRSLSDKEIKDLGFNKEEIIFEHKKVPYVSYPYEWSFSQLKAAALHHLDFNLFLLNQGATLIDASAYNIQFIGSKPIFIDLLSIKEYIDGEYWYGHKQFCENFLNPLVLTSKKGVQFNNWFKGNLEGIPTNDLNNLLSFLDKFSYNIFVHVYLLNENYSVTNTYEKSEENEKVKIVKKFINQNNFNKIIDLGCNDGFYSKIAVNDNANFVVGFDYDPISIDRAFNDFKKNQTNFLPLIFDATNPSSNIGWNENERKSFNNRADFDALLALAFEHHLVIAKNIPLLDVINWLTSLAPKGLIEFVPKNDETIQKMIKFKGDIFPDYNESNFRNCIEKKAKILSINQITSSGRKIYQYEK